MKLYQVWLIYVYIALYLCAYVHVDTMCITWRERQGCVCVYVCTYECMYVYIFVSVCLCFHAEYIYIYIYIHTHIHTLPHTSHLYEHKRTYTPPIDVYITTNAYIHTRLPCVCVNACVCVYVCMYIYIYIYICIYRCMHICMYIP
jgi:hypothetical protein